VKTDKAHVVVDGTFAMTLAILLIIMTLFLAFANGANDNFKGVATLYGSNTVSYKSALALATIATFAGSIASVFLAAGLIKVFSGRGVVPDQIAASVPFLVSVAAGAAGTVMLATVTGFPISTTHALTGAIIGAGLMAVGTTINIGVIGTSFFAPLLLSPLVAICLTAPLYRALKWFKAKLAITQDSCICIGAAQLAPTSLPRSGATAAAVGASLVGPIVVGPGAACQIMNGGQLLVAPVKRLIDYTHYFTAAAVSFARGVNDTPKILALLVVLKVYDANLGAGVIAIAMAAGGLLAARKVAHTMSRKICYMEEGQALTANFVTALMVIVASRLGMPVSTTHVSVGAITGIGLVNGTANKQVISSILASWLLTLPIAAVFAATAYAFAQHLS
jgi:PiT family inorganic phosphate transporter